MFGLFKTEEQKRAEKLTRLGVQSLKNQFENAIAVAKYREYDTSKYDSRIKDAFLWGYIEGFLNGVFFDTGYPNQHFEQFEQQALDRLLPHSGVSIMKEVKASEEDAERFKHGMDMGLEDYDQWTEGKQPKKLGAFIIKGDKGLKLNL